MTWLRLRLELVTPCFLAGSDGKDSTAEVLREEGLRTASLIGQWRYWLRAALGSSDPSGWTEREALLFGSQSGRGRQGRVWLRPGVPNETVQVVNSGRFVRDLTDGATYPRFEEGHQPIDPLFYLLGQGLIGFNSGLSRPALQAGQSFDIEVKIRNGDATPWRDLRHAVWLWQTFGGIGARCRRGWGSVHVTAVDGLEAIDDEAERRHWQTWFAPQTPFVRAGVLARLLDLAVGRGDEPSSTDVYGRRLRSTWAFTADEADPENERSGLAESPLPFSHLGCCCAVLPDGLYDHWSAALAHLGNAMLRIRSNAPGRPRPGHTSRVRDHDAVFALLHRGAALPEAPQRAAFGLPHNYFFKSSGKKTTFEGPRGQARRASPVLFHVLKVWDGSRSVWQYAPVVLWLKSRLTPGDRVKSRDCRQDPAAPDWSAVLELMRLLCGLTAFEERRILADAPSEQRRTGSSIPPPPKVTVKPLNKGQERDGVLKRRESRWVAVFDGDDREAVLTNPSAVPADTTDGAKATLFIEEASKKIGIRARFVRRK